MQRLDELPPFLRVDQVMAVTQLGRSQIYELMRRWRESGGRDGIPCCRFGRVLRIPKAALVAMATLASPGAGSHED
jgi:hypothetical protein